MCPWHSTLRTQDLHLEHDPNCLSASLLGRINYQYIWQTWYVAPSVGGGGTSLLFF